MDTPEEHIRWALEIEEKVPVDERDLYLECLNGKPMSQRAGEREIRDGCILSNSVYLHCSGKHPLKN